MLLVAVALVQLSVPATMIIRREIVLHTGKQFRFRTAPVDPYDAFRGRYVWLSIMPNEAEYTGDRIGRGRKIFLTLKQGDDGFAEVSSVSLSRPKEGDFIQVKSSYAARSNRIGITWPFTRYYMEESAAPEAERVYRDRARRDSSAASVTVRVRRGFGVLEELYIEDLPIKEFLATQKQ